MMELIECGIIITTFGLLLIGIGQTMNIMSRTVNKNMTTIERVRNCRHINELIDLWDGLEIPEDSRFLMSRSEKMKSDSYYPLVKSHFKSCKHIDCPSNNLFQYVSLTFRGKTLLNDSLNRCSKRICMIKGEPKPFYRHILDCCYEPKIYSTRLIKKNHFFANADNLLKIYGRFTPTCHHIAESDISIMIRNDPNLNSLLTDEDIFRLLYYSTNFVSEYAPPCCSEHISSHCIWRSLVMINMVEPRKFKRYTRTRNFKHENRCFEDNMCIEPKNKTKILDHYVPGIDHSHVVSSKETLKREIDQHIESDDNPATIENSKIIKIVVNSEESCIIKSYEEAHYLGALFLTYHDLYIVPELVRKV